MGDEGFDDQFNDGLFRASLSNSRREPPPMWPKTLTQMRKHTHYGGQSMAPDHDTGHSNQMASRARGQWRYAAGQKGWVWSDAR